MDLARKRNSALDTEKWETSALCSISVHLVPNCYGYRKLMSDRSERWERTLIREHCSWVPELSRKTAIFGFKLRKQSWRFCDKNIYAWKLDIVRELKRLHFKGSLPILYYVSVQFTGPTYLHDFYNVLVLNAKIKWSSGDAWKYIK